jgi:hypothetical protein
MLRSRIIAIFVRIGLTITTKVGVIGYALVLFIR